MQATKTIAKWWNKFIALCQNILVPENFKIQNLLNIEAGIMRELLPKSAVYVRDIVVLFDYQNSVVRLVVKSIKYKNNANLRRRIALYLYEELLDMVSEIILFEGNAPLLVPMPMSPKEKRERGFNQCEELVREIKKLGGQNIAVSYDTLKKVRETQRQTHLSKQERIENVKNSMQVFQTSDVGKLKNQVVIVLDDVYTTGATLTEARRALIEAGAKRVIGLFIAH